MCDPNHFSGDVPSLMSSVGDAVAVSFVHPETGRAVTAVGVEHIPEATLAVPDIRFIQGICGTIMSQSGEVNVFNEGRVPQIDYQGRRFPGSLDRGLDAADLDRVVRVDGERGLVVAMARKYGHKVVGEDNNAAIIATLEGRGFERGAIRQYLTNRQLTNYVLTARDERPTIEEYIKRDVVDHYDTELEGIWGGFGASLEETIDATKAELADTGLTLEDERAMTDYLLQQSTPGPALAQLEKDANGLSRTQEVTIVYNRMRDLDFIEHTLGDWDKPEPPYGHTLTMFGRSHLDAIVEEAARRDIISAERYGAYLALVQRIGQRALCWSALEPAITSAVPEAASFFN